MKKKLLALCLMVAMVLGLLLPTGAAEHFVWQQEPDLLEATAAAYVCTVGDEIYIFGGMDSGIILKTVQIYNTATGQWRHGEDMPGPLSTQAGAYIDGKVYLIGGITTRYSSSFSSKIYIYNVAGDSWEEKDIAGTGLTSVIYLPGSVAYGGKMYIFGGLAQNNAPTNLVQIYDPVTNTATNGSLMPEARYVLNAILVEDMVYVVGGMTTAGGPTISINVYDIKNDLWLSANDRPADIINTTGINGSASVYHEGKIYVFGGYEVPLAIKNNIWVYDIASDNWTFYPSALPAINSHARAAVINGRLYLLGGNVGNESTKSYNTMYSISLEDKLNVLLDIGEEVQLSLDYSLTINPDYTWTSTDTAVAIVDSMGNVTAIGEGTCYIECRSTDGTYADYIPVKVIEGAPEIRLAVHLTDIDNAKRLWIHDPATAVTWTSLSPSVATVDNMGKVTAVDKGLAIIKGEIGGREYHIYVRVSL